MKVFILAESLRNGDAVGNNVMQEYLALREQKYDIHLYSANYDDSFAQYLIDRESLLKYVKREDALILYHHSIYWEEGGIILDAARCKILLRYHNITPDHFFTQYSELFSNLSRLGRQQTKDIIMSGKINHYLPVSPYNAAELIESGAHRNDVTIVPPFHKISDFDDTRVNLNLLETLLDGKVNVLSVGRVVPNKGFHHTVEVIDRYMSYYGNDVRLNIVGGRDPHFEGYVDELMNRMSGLGLDDHVIFTGKVSFEDLHTYYAASHVFLLMSEHEGFCLPILEAQYHKLPVIALDRCAVKDTLGAEQLALDEADYDLFASAIHTVVNDNIMRNYLADNGYKNYRNYLPVGLSDKLLRIINEHA
jgi:glycosyltransferase involved in cell wall biosynthesis